MVSSTDPYTGINPFTHVWWFRTVIPILETEAEDCHEFRDSLDYKVNTYPRKRGGETKKEKCF